jgi:hypothetical protein
MRVHMTPNETSNMALRSRFSVSIAALMGLGAAVWSGCGSSAERIYCDDTGCYTCDGYGCTAAPPPTMDAGTYDATGTDAGSAPRDAGSNSPDGSTCTIAAECAGAQACVAGSCQECGGSHGPCACTKTPECPAESVCVGGICTSNTNACQYPSDCDSASDSGAGETCISGKCETACGTVQCPSDATCVKGGCQKNPTGPTCATPTQCSGATPYCVGGQCVAACTDDPQCGAGYYCNQGACQPDTRPQGNCNDQSPCNPGQTCIRGICKYPCTTDTECEHIDARIAYCGIDKVCRSYGEAHPQCTGKSDCAAAQDCVGNTCQ